MKSIFKPQSKLNFRFPQTRQHFRNRSADSLFPHSFDSFLGKPLDKQSFLDWYDHLCEKHSLTPSVPVLVVVIIIPPRTLWTMVRNPDPSQITNFLDGLLAVRSVKNIATHYQTSQPAMASLLHVGREASWPRSPGQLIGCNWNRLVRKAQVIHHQPFVIAFQAYFQMNEEEEGEQDRQRQRHREPFLPRFTFGRRKDKLANCRALERRETGNDGQFSFTNEPRHLKP